MHTGLLTLLKPELHRQTQGSVTEQSRSRGKDISDFETLQNALIQVNCCEKFGGNLQLKEGSANGRAPTSLQIAAAGLLSGLPTKSPGKLSENIVGQPAL